MLHSLLLLEPITGRLCGILSGDFRASDSYLWQLLLLLLLHLSVVTIKGLQYLSMHPHCSVLIKNDVFVRIRRTKLYWEDC